MDRIDALQSMLEADPSNHFVRYALAHEYVKLGDDGLAVQEFQRILEASEDYQAAYYHAGKALERLDRVAEARALYIKGIEVSHRTGDSHARSELEAALEEAAA